MGARSDKTALSVLCYFGFYAGLQDCHSESNFLNSSDYHKASINKLIQFIQGTGMAKECVMEHTTNYCFQEQSDAHPLPYCFILFHSMEQF